MDSQAQVVQVPQPSVFDQQQYVIRRKVLKLVGAAFHVYDANGALAFYSEMKAFKLKEDIRVYADEAKQRELLYIQARQILDFSAAYDVVDSTTGAKVGALKRRGMRSMLRDEWVLMDVADNEVGIIQEDSMAMALLRRFLSTLIPQTYDMRIGDQLVAQFKQAFNPLVFKISLDFTPDVRGLLDRRLGVAAAVLLAAIEGRQG